MLTINVSIYDEEFFKVERLGLFRQVNMNFFSVLSRPNKDEYAEIMYMIYKMANEEWNYGLDRDIVLQCVEDYLIITGSTYHESDAEVLSYRDKAAERLRILKDCGWINIEVDNEYNQIISITENGYIQMDTLIKMCMDSNVEYTNKIQLIHMLLTKQSDMESRQVIKEVAETTTSLINNLKSLNSNIRSHSEKMMNDLEIAEILDLVGNRYKSDIVDKAYHRLKVSDSYLLYRGQIINQLEDFMYDGETLSSMAELEVEDGNFKTHEDAYSHLWKCVNDTREAFENFHYLMNDIDRRHNAFLSASYKRVRFQLDNRENIEGDLNKVIKCLTAFPNEAYEKNGIEEEINLNHRLHDYALLDESSIQTPRTKKVKLQKEKLPISKFTKEEEENIVRKNKEMMERYLNIDKVNHFILEKLAGKEYLTATGIQLNDAEDFIKLVIAKSKASHTDAKYTVERTGEYVETDEYILSDFVVKVKEKI